MRAEQPSVLASLRRDDGAMAVAMAFLAMLLLIVAALAVELTDAYTRDLAVQTRADMAALAAAQDLPDRCAAVNTAYRNLIADDNAVASSTAPPRVLTEYTDRVMGNGEIQVMTELVDPPPPNDEYESDPGAGWLDTGDCSESDASAVTGGAARFVRVVTPTATRSYSFAGISGLFGAEAADEVRLQRYASAGVTAPAGAGPGSILPLFLPDGCLTPPSGQYGSKTIIVAPSTRPASSSFLPSDSRGGGPTARTTFYEHLSDGTPSEVEDGPIVDGFTGGAVAVEQLRVTVATSAAPADLELVFDLHHGVDGTVTRVPQLPPGFRDTGDVRLADAPGLSGIRVPGSTRQLAADRWVSDWDVAISSTSGAPGTAILARPGPWSIRAGVVSPPEAGTGETLVDYFAGSPGVFYVDGDLPDTGSNTCGSATSGDFGMLQVPRYPEPGIRSGDSAVLADYNLALGVDHLLTAFPSGSLGFSECADGVAGAVFDHRLGDPVDRDPVEGANCVYIDSGKKVSFVTDGLITGVMNGGSKVADGRLQADAGFSAPPGPRNSACRSGSGGSSWTWSTPTRPSVEVTDAVLSCYVVPGRTLDDVKAGSPDSIRPEIFDDPRFFFTPVLNTSERPPSGGAAYYAIARFDAAFITSEGSAEESCEGLSCNGVSFFGGSSGGGGQKVKSVTAYVFPATALPSQIDQGENGDDFVTGTKDVLLLE